MEFFSWLGKNEIISFDKYGHLYLIEPKQNTIRTLNLNQKDSESNSILDETRSLASYGCLSHKRSSLLNKYLSPVKRIICLLKGFFVELPLLQLILLYMDVLLFSLNEFQF